MSTAAVNKSHPVPLPLMGRTSLDADTSVWPHHTYLMLGQRICSPEGQNDISIGTVRRCGSDLALNWVPHGEFVGLQGERQGGITGVNASAKSCCRLTEVSCARPAWAPLHIFLCLQFCFRELLLNIIQGLFPVLKSLFVYWIIIYIFFYFYGRFTFCCMSAPYRIDI